MTFDFPTSGGNTGSVHIPQQREHETSAFAQINKEALGITNDSIAKVLTEISPRYNYGYLGGFGYKATANRNVLEHPLESVMIGRLNVKPDETWVLVYDSLVANLPENLKNLLILENKKPLEERNSSFSALENLLQLTARTLANANIATNPEVSENSVEATRTALNLVLPFMALQSSLESGNEIAEASSKFLNEEGANFPNYDSYTNLLSQMSVILMLADQLSFGFGNASFNNSSQENLSQDTQNALLKSSALISNLNEQISRATPGQDLQILSTSLKTMENILTALSLPTLQSGALYLSLNTALSSLATNESALGLIGPNLNLVLTHLSDGIANSILPDKANLAGAKLLSDFITLSLILIVGISGKALDGYGPLPKDNSDVTNKNAFFAFEALISLISGSDFIKETYSSLIATSGGDENSQKSGSLFLSQLANVFVIYTALTINKNGSDDLFLDHSEKINQGLIAFEEMLQNNEVDLNAGILVTLKQASLALENKDFESFDQTINSFIESLGASSEELKKDLKNLVKATSESLSILNATNDDEPRAEIVSIV